MHKKSFASKIDINVVGDVTRRVQEVIKQLHVFLLMFVSLFLLATHVIELIIN